MTLDCSGIAHRIVAESRNPKLWEMIDLIWNLAIPKVKQTGYVITFYAEKVVSDFLTEHGFRFGTTAKQSTHKSDLSFQTTARWACISMAGQGKQPMSRPLLGEPNKVQFERHEATRYRLTQYAMELLGGSSNGDLLSIDDLGPELFGVEGPTGEAISMNYYQRDSGWREYLIRKLGVPVCWCCRRNMRDSYDAPWAALDVHHLDALATRSKPEKTVESRVKLVCCNCHAVHHRTGKEMEEISMQISGDKSAI